MIQEFKDFVSKGGIFEAAVGLVMALAFVPVVGALIEFVLMPIIARVLGQPDLSSLSIGLGGETYENADGQLVEASIGYGSVLNALIAFVSVAAVVFLMVKAYNKATDKQEEEDGPSDNDLLVEIRNALVKR